MSDDSVAEGKICQRRLHNPPVWICRFPVRAVHRWWKDMPHETRASRAKPGLSRSNRFSEPPPSRGDYGTRCHEPISLTWDCNRRQEHLTQCQTQWNEAGIGLAGGRIFGQSHSSCFHTCLNLERPLCGARRRFKAVFTSNDCLVNPTLTARHRVPARGRVVLRGRPHTAKRTAGAAPEKFPTHGRPDHVISVRRYHPFPRPYPISRP